MSDDPIAGLHKRFDKFEDHFKIIEKEQHIMAGNLVKVTGRLDVMDVVIAAAQTREGLVVGIINDKLDINTALTKKLFDRFDKHTDDENADRKNTLFWLMTTVVTVALGVIGVILTKVFGA